MAQIDVTERSDGTYQVTVTERETTTTHEIVVHPDDLARFGGGVPGDDLVEASFRFLLDREPKESIMSRFDLSVISRYFPEYSKRIGDYL